MRIILWIILVLCTLSYSRLIPSDDLFPEPLSFVRMTEKPLSTQNGSVNVISGEYIEAGTECIVSGPDPYILGHSYVSSHGEQESIGRCSSFSHYHLLKVIQPEENKAKLPPNTQLFLYGLNGEELLFEGDTTLTNFRPVLKGRGYTSTASSNTLSGKNSIHNIRLSWDAQKDEWLVQSGDGSKRLYARVKSEEAAKKLNDRDYHIIEEKKPSGNLVLYTYNSEMKIAKITTNASDRSCTINSVEFRYPDSTKIEVATSDGSCFYYYLQTMEGLNQKLRFVLRKIIKPGKAAKLFEYVEEGQYKKIRLTKVSAENGPYVETSYCQEELISNRERRKYLKNRVEVQKAPLGLNGEPMTTHVFLYHPLDRQVAHTTVYDVMGNKIRYFYDEDKRITRIKLTEKSLLAMSESFIFGKKDSDQEGNMIARILFDENNLPVFARCYEYDERHNVVKETLFGNFSTASEGAILLDANGFPVNSPAYEEKITKYIYSTDGFNLQLSVCDPAGNYTLFQYKEGTNLMTAKFSCVGQIIKKREFYEYDNSANLILKIIDDGTSQDKNDLQGITKRHTTRYIRRLQTPHFGDIVEIYEYSLNLQTSKDTLLSHTINHFTKDGLIDVKENYDGQNILQSRFEYGYDSTGLVIYTQGPSGDKEFFTYDQLGRLSSKKGPKDGVETRYSYDVASRLVKEEEYHSSRLTRTLKYRYDFLGRKISISDSEGNETKIQYDSLNRVTKVAYPKRKNDQGMMITPIRSYKYVGLYQAQIEIDESGNETKRTYSADGKLLSTHVNVGNVNVPVPVPGK